MVHLRRSFTQDGTAARVARISDDADTCRSRSRGGTRRRRATRCACRRRAHAAARCDDRRRQRCPGVLRAGHGVFKKAGFDVEITSVSSGPTIAAGVASGSFDFAQVNVPSLVSAHDKGVAFTMVAPAGLYSDRAVTTALIVAGTSPLRTAKDLTGKTIAVNALAGIQQIAADAWIDKNGGDSTSVKFVELSIGQQLAALPAGRVDAAVVTQPGLDGAAHDPSLRVMAPIYNGIADTFLVSAWMGSTQYVKDHPDIVKRFADVMAATARWANAHQAQSAVILEKYTKLAIGPTTTRVRYAESFNPNEVQPVIDVSAKYGLIKKTFPASEFYAR
jgi:ABC-type nitrate/sulfonate/bicarbonate transport system substrate-binding protein